MLPPASAVASAVVLLALAGLGAAEPLRVRRSPPFEPFPDEGNYYMGDEFARAASPPAGLLPSAYTWIRAVLAHAEALTKQAQQLAEALQHKLVSGSPGRRAGEDDEHAQSQSQEEAEAEEKARQAAEKAKEEEEKAKEEAAKVAAMQAKIHEQQQQMQAQIHAAQEAMQKQLAEATQGLSHLFRFRRSAAAPWEPLQQAQVAAVSGLRQMEELIRIRDGEPLHTVRLPGFPSQMFQPEGVELPGFLAGTQFGQQS